MCCMYMFWSCFWGRPLSGQGGRVGTPLLSVRSLFLFQHSMTYHHSSDVDRGTHMYIGTHCEREDPYGFLSTHCVLDLDTNMLQWVFALCAICQVTYRRIVPIMTLSRTLSFCMGRGIWNMSQRTVRCHGYQEQ